MSSGFVKEAVRRNWYLLLLLAIIVVTIVSTLSRGGPPTAAPPRTAGAPGVSKGEEATAPIQSSGTAKRLTPAEQALETIRAHQAQVEADPRGDKAPSLLFAAGNLYLERVHDNERAVEMYERVLADYSYWDGIRRTYPQLAVAYERLGNVEKVRSVYQEMMQVFPEESVEHQYAKDRLSKL